MKRAGTEARPTSVHAAAAELDAEALPHKHRTAAAELDAEASRFGLPVYRSAS